MKIFLVGEGDQVILCAYGHSTATEVAFPDFCPRQENLYTWRKIP